jgi:hypothetical protein
MFHGELRLSVEDKSFFESRIAFPQKNILLSLKEAGLTD